MPASAFQSPLRSNPSTHFTEALATNEISATVSLPFQTRDPLWFIRAIAVVATQNRAYEVQFFSSATNLGGTLPTDNFVAAWQFGEMDGSVPASPGYPVSEVGVSPGDPYYHYYIDGLWIPYYDGDQLSASSRVSGGTYPNNAKLHMRLINRSTASKSADAAGALMVTVFAAPQGQQV